MKHIDILDKSWKNNPVRYALNTRAEYYYFEYNFGLQAAVADVLVQRRNQKHTQIQIKIFIVEHTLQDLRYIN